MFRDCNGESNGIELPEDTILAEAAAAAGDVEDVDDDIEFPEEETDDNDLGQLSQQVQLTVAPPLPILDLREEDYQEIPLNGLYQAPGK